MRLDIYLLFYYLLQLRQEEREVQLGNELRTGEEGVQVEPLSPETADRQPVLAVVADEGSLHAGNQEEKTDFLLYFFDQELAFSARNSEVLKLTMSSPQTPMALAMTWMEKNPVSSMLAEGCSRKRRYSGL